MALMQCQPCQLPGKPGMLQLLHWSVPSLLALGGDGGGVGDSSLLQGGMVQKERKEKRTKRSVAQGEGEVHQGRLLMGSPAGCPDWL